MIHDFLFLLIGLALIIGGGNYVTDGGVIVARRLGISPLLVGLTIVAFGSSAPDLAVSVMATAKGHSAMAVGDVVGADVFDMLLVVGVTALIAPVTVTRCVRRLDLPMLLLASAFLFVCANRGFLTGHGIAEHYPIGRMAGLLMLLFYAGYIYMLVRGTREDPRPGATAKAKGPAGTPAAAAVPARKVWLAVLMIAGGLGALVLGGNLIVEGGSGIALKAGMSEGLVGLTIVGIGSSLPDLSTSAMAALKKQPGLAVGNIVGSCIFDVLVVLGTSACIGPLTVEGVKFANFCVLLGAALLLIALIWKAPHRIGRVAGALLLALYAAYMTWTVIAA